MTPLTKINLSEKIHLKRKGTKMKKLLLLIISLALFGCTSEDQLRDMLKKNPKILTDAIEANPEAFIESLNKAVKQAQQSQAGKREEDEKKKLEESFENPLKPVIRKDELIRGTKGAPITIVEYSDFECPFCSRGFNTVLEILDAYKGKVQFVYKHLPLSFHAQAEIASRYYEAARLQSEEKAILVHDDIYKNQRKLRDNGEKYLKELAKKIGLDMKRLEKDLNSEAVTTRIEEDKAEAEKFGFQGTPGFIVNGVPVKGAYPKSHFVDIINELVKRGKLTL
jgi:protein-disulfide isomerase